VDVSNTAKKQIEPWLTLESIPAKDLIGLICSWRCLMRCDLYELDGPINLALRVSVEHGNNELEQRGVGRV
jgi:hypothetical protein